MKKKQGRNTEEKKNMTINFKIFDLYDISGIEVKDPGLKSVINLQPKLILQSHGRNVQRLGQMKVNIVERLMNRIAVAGHRGKKHKIAKGTATGKYTKNMKMRSEEHTSELQSRLHLVCRL